MGGAPPPGAPDQLQNFYHTVLTFERAMYAVAAGLNLTLTTKKGRQLFGRRKVHPERENSGYAYEKRAPALRMGPPNG